MIFICSGVLAKIPQYMQLSCVLSFLWPVTVSQTFLGFLMTHFGGVLARYLVEGYSIWMYLMFLS